MIAKHNSEGDNMDQEILRKKLKETIASGFVARAISRQTGIAPNVLSRFKNGYTRLGIGEAKILEAYLNEVKIPIF